MNNFWDRIQRIETLMVQSAAKKHRQIGLKHLEDFQIEPGPHNNLLIRIGSGFDPQNIRVSDYHRRYPFSSVKQIAKTLDEMHEQHGWVTPLGEGHYQFTELGVEIVTAWMNNMGKMIMTSPTGTLTGEDIESLIAYDFQILEAMKTSPRPHDGHVFKHRLKGIQPDRHPPELWHHWQWVWHMICFREDEEGHVRRQRGLAPLAWFVRRQLSFADLRPWLVRAPLTVEHLANRAKGYSPMDDPQAEAQAALAILDESGWLRTDGENEYRLTEAGLAAHQADEQKIEDGFMSAWPDFGEDAAQFEQLLERFNQHYEALME